AVPLLLALLTGPARRRHGLLAGASTAVVCLVTAVPWGLGRVWDQSVRYHLDAAGFRTPGANVHKVLMTLKDRDLPLAVLGLAALAIGVAALFRAGLRPRLSSPLAPPAGWLLATLAVLVLEHPLWRSHNA